MNISYLKNKNIHFVECENWHDAYGYEKSEMKEDTINYIEQLQQENKQLKERIDKAIEYIDIIQNEFNDRAIKENNLYIFESCLKGVSKLLNIKRKLKGENNE